MAKGRTIGVNNLTDQDIYALELCRELGKELVSLVPDSELAKSLMSTYAKVNVNTRDAGSGLGGGKWQRDAVTTRGVTSKAPISNRNLRWHPMAVATKPVRGWKIIDSLAIEKVDGHTKIVFSLKDQNGNKKKYLPEEVYALNEKFLVLPEHFNPHVDIFKLWTDDDWTRNSCLIQIEEACSWQESVETYAVLASSILQSKYSVSSVEISLTIENVLKNFGDSAAKFKISHNYPSELQELRKCPVCLNNLDDDLTRFRFQSRADSWQPSWRNDKRGEGEDSSLQVMHVDPLIEAETRHHAGNVRYGHRWCNIAMTDHTLGETLSFMGEIVGHHK